MSKIKLVSVLVAFGIALYVLMSSIYTVSEVEQAVCTARAGPRSPSL